MENNFLTNFFGLNQNNQLNRFINQVSGRLPYASQIWGKKEAVWVDTNDSWRLFIEIPELRAVIDKRLQIMLVYMTEMGTRLRIIGSWTS